MRLAPRRPSSFLVHYEPAKKDSVWSKYTDLNVLLLAQGGHTKDYADLTYVLKNKAMSKLAMSQFDFGTPLYDYLRGNSGVMEIDEKFARWRLYGEPDMRAMSFGDISGLECPGLGGLPFDIKLDVDWYGKGDLIAPWKNKRCIIRIIKDAVPSGGGFIYEVELFSDDKDAFFPPEYLESGQFFLKMGGAVIGEASEDAGTLQFGDYNATYVEYEVPLTEMSWEFEVTDEAHRASQNILVSRCEEDPKTKKVNVLDTKLSNMLEAAALRQIDHEKELYLTYGEMVNGSKVDWSSGKPIYAGPGLFSFMSEGNVRFYNINAGSLDQIVDEIRSVWIGRIPIAQRQLLLFTGEGGLKLFHDWIEEKYGNTATIQSTDFTLGSATPFASDGRKGYSFPNFQFTEYKIQPFGSIRVAHWGILDNPKINGVMAPDGRLPLSSYEFFAFNIGLGDPNMQLVRRRNSTFSAYRVGYWTPMGPVDSSPFSQPVLPGKYYRWRHYDSFGLIMFDPSCSLWFKPNVT